MRAFPSYYRGNSAYAFYPFVHPDRTKEILTKIGKVDDYDFSTPTSSPRPLAVKSYKTVKEILDDKKTFNVPCKENPHSACKRPTSPFRREAVELT
jgi:hypothetical protein